MTVITMCVAAWLAAWARDIACHDSRRIQGIAANTVFFVFLAVTFGAGIQFTFKG